MKIILKDVFRKMSELYQAQDNILSKAGKIVKKSLITKCLKSKKKATIWAGTIYWGNKLLDALWQ